MVTCSEPAEARQGRVVAVVVDGLAYFRSTNSSSRGPRTPGTRHRHWRPYQLQVRRSSLAGRASPRSPGACVRRTPAKSSGQPRSVPATRASTPVHRRSAVALRTLLASTRETTDLDVRGRRVWPAVQRLERQATRVAGGKDLWSVRSVPGASLAPVVIGNLLSSLLGGGTCRARFRRRIVWQLLWGDLARWRPSTSSQLTGASSSTGDTRASTKTTRHGRVPNFQSRH